MQVFKRKHFQINHFLDNIMSKYLGNWLVSCEAERERESRGAGAGTLREVRVGRGKWRVERGEVAEGGEWPMEDNLSINHFHSTLTDNDGKNSRKDCDNILGECLTNERR